MAYPVVAVFPDLGGEGAALAGERDGAAGISVFSAM